MSTQRASFQLCNEDYGPALPLCDASIGSLSDASGLVDQICGMQSLT